MVHYLEIYILYGHRSTLALQAKDPLKLNNAIKAYLNICEYYHYHITNINNVIIKMHIHLVLFFSCYQLKIFEILFNLKEYGFISEFFALN